MRRAAGTQAWVAHTPQAQGPPLQYPPVIRPASVGRRRDIPCGVAVPADDRPHRDGAAPLRYEIARWHHDMSVWSADCPKPLLPWTKLKQVLTSACIRTLPVFGLGCGWSVLPNDTRVYPAFACFVADTTCTLSEKLPAKEDHEVRAVRASEPATCIATRHQPCMRMATTSMGRRINAN